MSDSPTGSWGDTEWAVYEKVRAFVADAADVKLQDVEPHTDIFKDLGVDSLGFLLIFINLEDEYGISAPGNFDDVGPTLRTPADIVAFSLDVAREKARASHD